MDTDNNELELVDFEAMAKLNDEMDKFCLNKGIAVALKKNDLISSDSTGPVENTADSSWLKDFEFQAERPAFYLSIDSQEDIQKWVDEIQNSLGKLVLDSRKYSEENKSFFSQNMLKKFQHFIGTMIKCRKRFMNSYKKVLEEDCDTIDELRQQTAKVFSSILKDYFFSTIVEPVYMGMAENQQNVYRYLINKINPFLSGLGIEPIILHPGDEMNYELYEPTEDSAKNITHDENLKDRVKEVSCYAYAFKGNDKVYPIMNGKASVWAYRKE